MTTHWPQKAFSGEIDLKDFNIEESEETDREDRSLDEGDSDSDPPKVADGSVSSARADKGNKSDSKNMEDGHTDSASDIEIIYKRSPSQTVETGKCTKSPRSMGESSSQVSSGENEKSCKDSLHNQMFCKSKLHYFPVVWNLQKQVRKVKWG